MRVVLDRILRPLGLAVVRRRSPELLSQHVYPGGWAEYRKTQIFHNKRSVDRVWADDATLSLIAEDLKAHDLGGSGICHGARNGFEVAWFRANLGGDVIGTDISDTANDLPHMHEWDFHDENPDWIARFDFVYTNSLDHAMEPDRALKTWANQISPHGRIYVEHSTGGSTARDPFGAHSMILPYLFFKWGRGHFELVDVIEIVAKRNNGVRATVFVLQAV